MVKYIIGWCIVLLLRLIPFRPANVEPLMATLMPFSKKYGALGGFVFASLSMVIYDAITGKLGSWTLWTSLTYGVIGALAYWFFKNRKGSVLSYVAFSVIGTLVFDIVTGVAMGPLLYGQPFMDLASSIVSSAVLSVAIERWLVENPALEFRLKRA
jgi:uncharacterized membrane protein